MDVFQKCSESAIRTDGMRAAGVYPYYRVIQSAQDPVVLHEGRELVMLGSNNYLGLTNHPEVKAAAAAALALYGTGCAGSRLLNGTLEIHVELEERLAAFMGREAALTFSTGFQVNLGVLSCLLDRSDVAILDALDHACIIDGCRLGFGKTYKYRHNDMDDLEKKLRVAGDGQGQADRRRRRVLDGGGSREPAGDRGAQEPPRRALMVDDAHGLGVFGENGRGTPEHFGLEHEVDLVMGTFSKSLAAIGGFVAGNARVIEHIKHNARAEIFSAAPPPASVAAALKALELIEREPERRKRLWENTHFMKKELAGDRLRHRRRRPRP